MSSYCSAAGNLVQRYAQYIMTALHCLQNLAVDSLYYLPTVHEATARTCALVCLTDAFPLQLALRAIDALISRPCVSDTSILLSFLVTVLLGRVNNAQLSVNSSRHAALVSAVCRALPHIADTGTSPVGLLDCLLQSQHCIVGHVLLNLVLQVCLKCPGPNFSMCACLRIARLFRTSTTVRLLTQ